MHCTRICRDSSKEALFLRDKKIYKLSLYAMLSAVMILMTVFPSIGYITIGPVQITFMMIPVTIGCMTLGPNGGAILGAIFGATSFAQCFLGNPFAVMLFGINPFYTAVTCFIPRIAMGYICGWLFRLLQKFDKTNFLSFAVTSLSGALLNTVLYIGSVVLLFNDYNEIITMLVSVSVLINGICEAGMCMIAGTAISKALFKFLKRKSAD